MENDYIVPKPVLGWREWIGLPDLGVDRIKVKVDTGARSSSLHVGNLREFERDGATWVRFEVHPLQDRTDEVVVAEAEVFEYRSVRSSSGRATMRPVIITTVEVLDTSWAVELTLANRNNMSFRMLLGREAIRGRFLVDAGSSFNVTPK
jgi:hypothetical protein